MSRDFADIFLPGTEDNLLQPATGDGMGVFPLWEGRSVCASESARIAARLSMRNGWLRASLLGFGEVLEARAALLELTNVC
jgi:hypothetical protein